MIADEFSGNTLRGMQIIIDEDRVPRMLVSQEFARLQNPELVHQTQEWLTDFFGTKWKVETGTVMTDRVRLIMNPVTYQQLKTRLKGMK